MNTMSGGDIQNPSQSSNSKKRCRWSGTACHRSRSTRLLKAKFHTTAGHIKRYGTISRWNLTWLLRT